MSHLNDGALDGMTLSTSYVLQGREEESPRVTTGDPPAAADTVPIYCREITSAFIS